MFHDASVHGFGGQENGEVYLGYDTWASLVAQRVKNLPAMWETWVQSPGWEDPLVTEYYCGDQSPAKQIR